MRLIIVTGQEGADVELYPKINTRMMMLLKWSFLKGLACFIIQEAFTTTLEKLSAIILTGMKICS